MNWANWPYTSRFVADEGGAVAEPSIGAASSASDTPASGAAATLAPRGVLVDGSYSNAAGTLGYKLFVPSGGRRRLPLFVMLHGCSQTAADFAVGTRMNELAEELGGIVVYPEQSAAAHPLGCWNWYDTRHQIAEGGEPSLIAGITRQVIETHAVDRSRVYVAGMSAGGAMAVILGQSYPRLYAAVGVHSGMPCGVATDMLSGWSTVNFGPGRVHGDTDGGTGEAANGRSIATIVFHGDRDGTVHPANGAAVYAQARRGVMRRRTGDRVGARSGAAAGVEAGPRMGAGAQTVVDEPPASEAPRLVGGRQVTRSVQTTATGVAAAELWVVHGSGHAWTGGSREGSFTDESGPDASREMWRFFLQHRLG